MSDFDRVYELIEAGYSEEDAEIIAGIDNEELLND